MQKDAVDVKTRRPARRRPADVKTSFRRFGLAAADLYQMAERRNEKRGFLFVSRLIGKHIPIPPQVVQIAGALLAEAFYEDAEGAGHYDAAALAGALKDYAKIPEALREAGRGGRPLSRRTLVIGFAETATGLAQAFASAFGGNYDYVQTTRERYEDMEPSFRFEEEHSHATAHLCYFADEQPLRAAERVVLVDDELTTGRTALNLIRAMRAKCPAKEFVVASLLDWRGSESLEQFRAFERECGVSVRAVRLMAGSVRARPAAARLALLAEPGAHTPMPDVEHVSLGLGPAWERTTRGCPAPVSPLTGRFCISSAENAAIAGLADAAAPALRALRKSPESCCLGTGELIWLPALLAARMGGGCLFHSTTLSPVYPADERGYPVKNAMTYTSPDGRTFYIYNILPGRAEEVFLFTESRLPDAAAREIAAGLGGRGVGHVVFVSIL